MVSIATENTVGAVGMLFILIGVFLGGLPVLVGYVILLVSLYMLSSKLGLDSFHKALMSVILSILAVVIFFLMLAGYVADLGSAFFGSSAEGIAGGQAGLLMALVVFFVLFVYASFLLKDAFYELGDRLNHRLFKTTGTLLFWGSVLTVVLVGVIIYMAGVALGAVAFFSAPKEVKPRGL